VISVRKSEWIDDGMANKPFRFENAWTRNDRYSQTFEESWKAAGSSLQEVYDALGGVRDGLKRWSRSEFGSVRKQLNSLRDRLESVRFNNLMAGPSAEEKSLMAKISELLSREESLEKQRSRALWLKDGHRNTSFFLAKAKERAQRNKIKLLRRGDGSIITSQEGLEYEAIGFYQNLFSTQVDTNPSLVTEWVVNKVTD
jgi:hypothetical protein